MYLKSLFAQYAIDLPHPVLWKHLIRFNMYSLSPRHITFVAAILLLPVASVAACETDCIDGITRAVIGNYTPQVNLAFGEIVSLEISKLFLQTQTFCI